MNRITLAGQAIVVRLRGQISQGIVNGRSFNTQNYKPEELVDILYQVSSRQLSANHLPQAEEGILNLLTARPVKDEEIEDDMVSKFIPKAAPFTYKTLCKLLIGLSDNKRRPPPILRIASSKFCQIAMPNEPPERPDTDFIVATLKALANLNYPNRNLIGKLTTDLTEIINLQDLSPKTICNLLRSLGSLRWRHPVLMEMLYDHVYQNSNDFDKVNGELVITLLHVTALLNFRPKRDIREFYNHCMKGEREQLIDKTSKRWLNYVWVLTALEVVDASHLRSVLSKEFIDNIDISLSFSDRVKLLNLLAIARFEFRDEILPCRDLGEKLKVQIRKSNEMEKFSRKIESGLLNMVKSSEMYNVDVETPYGFIVDCEFVLNENHEPVPKDEVDMLDMQLIYARNNIDTSISSSQNWMRCALIYVAYDETITNNLSEPVGHKNMIARILKHVGYETFFIAETIVNRERTSAGLTQRIQSIITNIKPDETKASR